MSMRRGNYKNPCLTMHQPWASLLVHGIKRIEGRSWPSPIRGRLWIHAASKVPDEATIKAMEEFYREIYAVDGITDIQFPKHYPVSRLIGCVEIVGCVTCDELQNWEALPEGVRLEGQTNFCWLCEQPQKLIIPFEMRGYQGVYNLENKIHAAAARGLTPSQNLSSVKFPLPDRKDPFSLKPGSVSCTIQEKNPLPSKQLTSVTAAIAGARAAATQFSKEGQIKPIKENAKSLDNPVHVTSGTCDGTDISRSKSKDIEEIGDDDMIDESSGTCDRTFKKNKSRKMGEEGCSSKVENYTKLIVNYNVESNKRSVVTEKEERTKSVGVRRFDPGTARIMAAAIRNLKPSSS